MRRDFSERSKQNLHNLVSQVENEKWNNFTDWVGDRWLDYQTWIGNLNIKNYINNVNEYHKKVIDRQNATSDTIDTIFKNVADVDCKYAKYFEDENVLLKKWNDFIVGLTQIIHPNGTNFNLKFMAKSVDGILNDIKNLDVKFENGGFASFSDIDILQRFLLARNGNKDAVLFALTRDLFAGVKSLINDWFGKDNMNDIAFKNSIKAIIERLDPSLLDISREQTALNIAKTTNGMCKDYNDFCELLRENDESLKKFLMMDDDSYEKVGKFIKYGKAGVDAIEVIFTDYCNTIALLEEFRDGLITVNGDATTIGYCNELISEYKNKFGIIIDQIYDMTIDKGMDITCDTILNTATGGLFGIANSVHELIWKISGVTSKGDDLGSIYASAFYSDDLIASYEHYVKKLESGNYSQDDVIKCKQLFEMAKAAKIEELQNIKKLTHKEFHDEIDEQLNKLKEMQWNSIDSWKNI